MSSGCHGEPRGIRSAAGFPHKIFRHSYLTADWRGLECTNGPDPPSAVLPNPVDNVACHKRPGGEAAVHVEPAADNVRVVDSGLGLPAVGRPFVFQLFYRVRRPGTEEGSGLDLAIVEQLVRTIGGSVQLDPREGEGTEVTLLLRVAPRHVTPAPDLRPSRRAASPRAQARAAKAPGRRPRQGRLLF
jgi:Histidine kinase-, DNA gyrase B-, and HSP90-like ATPase